MFPFKCVQNWLSESDHIVSQVLLQYLIEFVVMDVGNNVGIYKPKYINI